MSSPTFLLVPVDELKYTIIPKHSIRRVTEDDSGICIEYRIGKSVGFIRPPSSVHMGNIVEALKCAHVYREL